MQPIYKICRTEQFEDDVRGIFGDLQTFERLFEGFAFLLSRLPRGLGTWDLSPTGDLRLATLDHSLLDDGTSTPAMVFSFALELGPTPCLTLLRGFTREQLAQAMG